MIDKTIATIFHIAKDYTLGIIRSQKLYDIKRDKTRNCMMISTQRLYSIYPATVTNIRTQLDTVSDYIILFNQRPSNITTKITQQPKIV